MKLAITIKTNAAFLTKFKSQLQGDWNGPEFDVMRTQWGKRYESFVRRRYSTFARGGGDWPPLALSTIKARRGPDRTRQAARKRAGKAGEIRGTARNTKRGTVVGTTRKVSILIDTGGLFRAVSIGQTGNVNAPISKGIKYGFNATRHTGKGKKHPTFAQIAAWHNEGGGNLPKRLILAAPNAQTQAGMTADMRRATARLFARLRKEEPQV